MGELMMGIFRHLWQSFKDLVEEVRGFRRDVREARAEFRRRNGLDSLADDDPPTEIVDIGEPVDAEFHIVPEPEMEEKRVPRRRK
jgi:hypothetical protein